MERLIQFTVDFDDEGVKRRIEDRAYNTIADSLKKDFRQKIIDGYGDLSSCGVAIINTFFNENKDKIIDKAAQLIAEKAMRTKAWKEKFGDAMEGKTE